MVFFTWRLLSWKCEISSLESTFGLNTEASVIYVVAIVDMALDKRTSSLKFTYHFEFVYATKRCLLGNEKNFW